MPAWTEAEEADLRRLDRPTFRARYPHLTSDAIRAKSNRLRERGEMGNANEVVWYDVDMVPVTRAERPLPPSVGWQPQPGQEPADIPEDEDALEALFTAYKAVRAAKNGLGDPDRVVAWHAPIDGPIGICFIGDVHAGGPIEYELFERDLDIVRDTDGLYMVYTGDLVNNFKAGAKNASGLYEDVFPDPKLQIAYITIRSRPVKPKIIAICSGNHDWWDVSWAGIDRIEMLAKDLGVTYFTEAGGSIFAHVGDERYHVIVKHQFRGGKRNSANTLYNDWPWTKERPDAVVLAHLHEPSSEQPIRNGEQVAYLRGGSYKLSDEWAASKGFRAHYGVPLIIAYPDTRKIIPFHGEHFLDGVRFLQAERSRYMDESQ